ncbi:EAL domain-containing protein [Methylomonas sp. SURF-2]|uniref:EAL domain-containing protein n=1 Tax=Methylomonas subterranea TaxID=2952225 RepID=A0ABT1TJQ6_9GAMM|nr:EAL domain-containing protein [Methylomonas sp. SURF-2]MCQ8105711.1 EAL domain-containing protein [Methylomonas sp. SURF-2]
MTNKSKILVVDDTLASLKLLSDLLKAEGYEVRSAISGELALESAISNPPDLLLLDVLMPGMDGFEVCRRLKANPNTRHVPVIFISALSDTDEKVQGFGLGAVDFVTKPYQREELLSRVRTHLEIERLRNHLEDMVLERSLRLAESETRLLSSLNDSMFANAQLRTLLHTIPELVWLKDPNGVFLTCNRQFERFLGAAEADIIGKTDYDFVDRELADCFRANDLKTVAAGQVQANEEWLTFADNGYRGLFETLKTPMRDSAGKLIGVLGIARDITERKAAEEQIQRHMRLYAALSRCNKAIAHCTGEAELFLEVCRAAVHFGGMKMAWVGRIEPNSRLILPAASFGEGADSLQQLYASVDIDSPFGHGPTAKAIREQRPYWCQDFLNDPITAPWKELALRAGWAASASLPLKQDGEVIGAFILYADRINAFDAAAQDLLVEMSMDINFALENFSLAMAQKRAEQEIERLAFYDPLTNLPNRRLLYDRLQQAIVANARHAHHGAALFIDLDNFKALNDTRGHNAGDLLLIEVARRLQACVREGDTVARLGGDEFVVILNGLSDDAEQASADTEKIGRKMLLAIGQPYVLEGFEHHCSASMGIGLFHNQEKTAEELLRYTDTALYQAKKGGRNTLLFYDPAMQAALEQRAALENDLRRALLEDQFVLYYQMQINRDGRIIGAEVLMRWQHPLRGLVSPLDFIPLAEETGLILPIGNWVIETACAQLKQWEADADKSVLQLAVNVSARQFHQADFVQQVDQAICRHRIAPNRLKLELTESLVLDDIEDTIVKMHRLKEIGISFSLDDFGTGYSSLYYLTKLPIDQLKIDQSFVRNIGLTQSDAVIVQTIIGMAINLNIESIAEGVETEAQQAFLETHGCHVYQGFLYSRPIPRTEFERLFERMRQKPPTLPRAKLLN